MIGTVCAIIGAAGVGGAVGYFLGKKSVPDKGHEMYEKEVLENRVLHRKIHEQQDKIEKLIDTTPAEIRVDIQEDHDEDEESEPSEESTDDDEEDDDLEYDEPPEDIPPLSDFEEVDEEEATRFLDAAEAAGWTSEYVQYYTEDGVLIDDAYEVLENPYDVIGIDIFDSLKFRDPEVDVVYVKNYRRNQLVEVEINRKSFIKDIMGEESEEL